MKISRLAVLICGVAAMIAPVANAQQQKADFVAPTTPKAVPGEFIVKYRAGAAVADAAGALRAAGVEVVDTLGLINAQVVRFPQGADMRMSSAALANLPNVEYYEPNYLYFALDEPNDPDYGQQWAWPKIAAPEGWNVLTDSSKVVVAVIDTGVDYTHADLAANMWRNPGETPNNNVDDDGNGIVDDVFGANFVPASATGDPMDDHSHGSHVAGTIGAVTDNGNQVAGTSWKAQIMAVKFLGAQGSGSLASAIRSIEYAIEKKANIMNNSWGGGGFSQALEDAIKAANNAGILFLAAAGNDGNNDNDVSPHYPSSYEVPNVLAVMATDQNDKRATFSSYGAKSVDLGAPGVGILSTTPNGQLKAYSGTSMATPHVSGAAALLKAQNPTLGPVELKQAIMSTAEPVAALSGLSVTGARLDLAKLLKPVRDCTAGQAQIAYNDFPWSERREFSSNSNVLSVDFTLPAAMTVDISVHGSASRVSGSGTSTFRTGVYSGAATNVMWTGSYRRGSYTSNGVSETVSSSFAIKLPAGKHTLYWKLWISNFTMQFDSGTITVRAFPCDMGGKLAGAGVLEAAAMMAQEGDAATTQIEATETDASGANVTILR